MKSLKGEKMRKYRKILFFITLSLIFGGCEITQTSIDNSKDKQYYVNKARNAIEKYRVTNHNEFYGFMLGENFEGRNSFPFSQDEETGGYTYNLKDPKGVFDTVLIYTDEIGEILQIGFIQTFNSYLDGMDFLGTIEEKLNSSYPAMEVVRGEDLSLIEIRVAKDDDDWIEKYSEYLDNKDRGYSLFEPTFPYILHSMLAGIKCCVMKTEGKPMFWMKYTGKEYVRMKELHKQKIKEKLTLSRS